MENSVSSAALNAAREQLDAAEAAREVILLQHIANGVIIDSRLEKRILHRLHGELVREEGYA